MPREPKGGGRNSTQTKTKKDDPFERYFLNGIMVFAPRKKAPDFVKVDVCINVDELTASLNDIPNEEEKIYGQICESKNNKYYLTFNRKKE